MAMCDRNHSLPAILLGVLVTASFGCASRAKPPVSVVLPAAPSNSTPDLGKSDSWKRHPFIFIGQLADSEGACAPEKGFAFTSAEDLLSGDCEREVKRDEETPATIWIAKCREVSGGVPIMKVAIMQILDKTVEGRDGQKVYQPTVVRNEAYKIATGAVMVRCRYDGFVRPRPPM